MAKRSMRKNAMEHAVAVQFDWEQPDLPSGPDYTFFERFLDRDFVIYVQWDESRGVWIYTEEVLTKAGSVASSQEYTLFKDATGKNYLRALEKGAELAVSEALNAYGRGAG